MTATDYLIEHLVDAERRLTVAFAKTGVDGSVLNNMRLLSNACVELRRLQARVAELEAENARLELWGKATFEAGFQERQRAERAESSEAEARVKELEAENARLRINQRCSAIEQGEVGYPCVFRAEIEAERDALRADAERYRWLRSNRPVSILSNLPLQPMPVGRPSWEHIDAAIDAVREGAK